MVHTTNFFKVAEVINVLFEALQNQKRLSSRYLFRLMILKRIILNWHQSDGGCKNTKHDFWNCVLEERSYINNIVIIQQK